MESASTASPSRKRGPWSEHGSPHRGEPLPSGAYPMGSAPFHRCVACWAPGATWITWSALARARLVRPRALLEHPANGVGDAQPNEYERHVHHGKLPRRERQPRRPREDEPRRQHVADPDEERVHRLLRLVLGLARGGQEQGLPGG